jgi:hypothetical protein
MHGVKSSLLPNRQNFVVPAGTLARGHFPPQDDRNALHDFLHLHCRIPQQQIRNAEHQHQHTSTSTHVYNAPIQILPNVAMKASFVAAFAMLSALLAVAQAQLSAGTCSGRGRNTGEITNRFDMEIEMFSSGRGNIYYEDTRGSFGMVSSSCNWTPSNASRLAEYPHGNSASTHSPGVRGNNPTGNCYIFQENTNAPNSDFANNHFSLSEQSNGSWWCLWIFTGTCSGSTEGILICLGGIKFQLLALIKHVAD